MVCMRMPQRPVTVSRINSTKQRAKSLENQSVVSRDGQRVVNAGEVGVAFAPDQFGGVERGDNVEEELGAAFDRLQHEVGDGPDVPVRDAAGEVAVVDGDSGHEDENAPEGNLAQDIGDAEAGERGELREGGSGAEDLMDDGELCGDQASARL